MPASVSQRLQAIILANRPRVHGGMRGGFELLAGQTTAQWWKRKAAERLICMRENRSTLSVWGLRQTNAAERLAEIRHCRMQAEAILAADPWEARAEPFRLAAE